MKAPTPTQAQVLRYISKSKARLERAPTYRELCAHFGWASTHSAADHVEALERKGLLVRTPRMARSWRLTDMGKAYLGVG